MTNDLRLHDNKSFDYFLKYPNKKAVCFVFDPKLADETVNKRFNKRAFQVFHAATEQLTTILRDNGITVEKHKNYDHLGGHEVVMSMDTTPFARHRQATVRGLATDLKIFDNKHLLGASAKKYKVFSSYYKDVVGQLVGTDGQYKTLRKKESDNFTKIKLYTEAHKYLTKFDPDTYRRTQKASVLVRSGATNVSWALARGIMSPREVYEHCRKECISSRDPVAMESLTRELIFRDFYSRATEWYIKDYSSVFRNKDNVKWKITTTREYISEIKDAPEVIKVIYDALIKSGRISNYGRMLFATWTYDIGANWHLGEELFAKHLLDYDYCSNHWNWAHHSIQGLNFSWPGKKYKIDNVTLYV